MIFNINIYPGEGKTVLGGGVVCSGLRELFGGFLVSSFWGFFEAARFKKSNTERLTGLTFSCSFQSIC